MSRRSSKPQHGVAMLVVLIFTLALTGIAIVSAKLALSGESVARNQLDLQVARQAAEAALRDAEKDLMIANGQIDFPGAVCAREGDRPVMGQIPQFTGNCLRGQCQFDQGQRQQADYSKAENPKTPQFAEVWWPERLGGLWGDPAKGKPTAGNPETCPTFIGGVPLGAFTGAKPMQGVALQPEYLIEAIRRGDDTYFRVTARGFGYRTGTEVVLQSYFQVPQM